MSVPNKCHPDSRVGAGAMTGSGSQMAGKGMRV